MDAVHVFEFRFGAVLEHQDVHLRNSTEDDGQVGKLGADPVKGRSRQRDDSPALAIRDFEGVKDDFSLHVHHVDRTGIVAQYNLMGGVVAFTLVDDAAGADRNCHLGEASYLVEFEGARCRYLPQESFILTSLFPVLDLANLVPDRLHDQLVETLVDEAEWLWELVKDHRRISRAIPVVFGRDGV